MSGEEDPEIIEVTIDMGELKKMKVRWMMLHSNHV